MADRSMRRTWFVVPLLAVMALAAPAAAHTELLESQPAAGTRLDRTPSELVLTFNEDVRASLATVTLQVGPRSVGGLEVRQGRSAATVVAEVPGDLPGSGSQAWLVRYRVTSTDGHPVEGRVDFRAPAGERSTPGRPERAGSADEPEEPPVSRAAEQEGSGTVSTLVIGALAALGVSVACALLIRARRRNGSS